MVVTTTAPTQVSICNLPNGQGWPLTQTKAVGSPTWVDATITLTLKDYYDDPVVGAPAEDLWLETTRSGLVHCAGGTTADGPTNELGQTTWSHSLRAGGYSDRQAGELTRVMVGLPADFFPFLDPDVNILHNSPDIDGNFIIDLRDTAFFARDLKVAYNYRSDFFYDGVINISDTWRFAAGLLGADIP
jgi:hypothetical protein